MKNLTTSLLIFTTIFSLQADVFLWEVTGNTHVTGSGNPSESIYSYIAPIQWDGKDHIVAARIAVKDSNGNLLRYLEDLADDGHWYSAYEAPVNIGHPNSPTGVGSGFQESNAHNSLMSGYYFQVQIAAARWVGDDTVGQYMLGEVLLYSDNVSGEYLRENVHYYIQGDEFPDGYSAWVPDEFYTYNPAIPGSEGQLPEPSSGILLLLGGGILQLRRKREKYIC